MLDTKHRADIARPFFRQHVVDRALTANRFEAIAVTARQHCRHVSAVTSAEHADTLAVNKRIFCQRAIEHRENIFNVGVTPTRAGGNWMFATKNRLTPCLLAPARAARVAHHNNKTGSGLHLRFVEICFAILRMWPAVHIQQHRILFR